MNYLIFLFILTCSQWALADWELKTQAPMELYLEPSTQSQIYKTLPANEIVWISRPIKTEDGEWFSFTLTEEKGTPEVFVKADPLTSQLLKNLKKVQRSLSNNLPKSIGFSLSLSQNVRAPISAGANVGQTVEYGPQYGLAAYPILYYEFPSKDNKYFRIFTSYRVMKSSGQTTLIFNGNISSQEIIHQEIHFISLGLLYRYFSSIQKSFWWGYGVELAKGTTGKQEITDGTFIDLKNNLPTNFYLQLAIGRQSRPIHNWQFIPEIKAGIVANNKPLTLNLEILLSTIYCL